MNSIFKRTLSILLVFVMCISMLPASALAEETEEVTETAEETEQVSEIQDEEPAEEEPSAEEQPAEEQPVEEQPTGEQPAEEKLSNEMAEEVLGTEDCNAGYSIETPDSPISNEIAQGTCGDNLTWKLDDTGLFTISGTGDMYDYDWSAELPWDSYTESIKTVNIADGVTSIGERAFNMCAELTSVKTGEGVTSIGDNAFASCTGLTSVDIGKNVVSIGMAAFYNCTSLVSIELPDNLSTIGDNAFRYCKNLKSINIPNGVTKIETDVFSGCSGMTSVYIPESVNTIEVSAFAYCSSLVEINISQDNEKFSSSNGVIFNKQKTSLIFCPGGITEYHIPDGVTEIEDNAFDGCSSITSVEIPNSVSIIGSSAFYECSNLTSINIPYKVTSLGTYVFNRCAGLTSIEIPANVSSIAANAFYGCDNLTEIVFLHDSNDPLTITNGAFYVASNSYMFNYLETTVKVQNTESINPAISGYNWSNSRRAVKWLESGSAEIITITSQPSSCTVDVGESATLSVSAEYSGSGELSYLWKSCNIYTVWWEPACDFGVSYTDPVFTVSNATENLSDYKFKCVITAPNGKTVETNEATVTVVNNGYTVKFDSNGGDGTMANQKFAIGESQNLNANEFTRTGYTFAGWKLGSKTYRNMQSVLNLTKTAGDTVTLTAQWKANSYTVLFDKNSATAKGTMSTQTMTYDAYAKLKTNAFKNTGYGFEGWSADKSAESAQYSNGEIVKNLASGGTVTLYAVWKPLAVSVDIKHSGSSVAGGIVDVDISKESAQYQLTAETLPEEASNNVQWKSSSSSVAKVDANGLVTFIKPGTVSVTATAADGSKKSAAVKFNVKYVDSATKFTSKTDAPSIGLQKGDTAQISIYGTDKSNPLNPELFTYQIATKGGEKYLKVNADGKVEALEGSKSVSVKASLTGDPLKRSVTVSIKTIPVQTGEITVSPAAGEGIHYLGDKEDGFYGVNAAGEICAESEAVGYALFVNKIDRGGAKQYYCLSVAANDSDGKAIEGLTGTSFTWTSSASKAAPVTAGKDGTVKITVMPDKAGEGLISATSKDLAKIKGSIAVYVMDKSPLASATSIQLDSLKTNEATLTLTSRYGNTIEDVKILEYNSKTKEYAESSQFIGSYDSVTGKLTVNARSYIANKNVATKLSIECANGKTYGIGLTVKVKNTLPSVTVKQPAKFNVFKKDSKAELTVTVKNETIEDMWLGSDYFKGEYSEGGKLTVSFSNPSAKPVTKATLYIKLEGYDNPVEKSVTIGTASTKPTVKLSPTSAKISDSATEKTATTTITVSDKTELSAGAVTSGVNFATASNSKNEVTVELVPVKGDYKGGTVKLAVQDENWTAPITCSFKVTLTK